MVLQGEDIQGPTEKVSINGREFSYWCNVSCWISLVPEEAQQLSLRKTFFCFYVVCRSSLELPQLRAAEWPSLISCLRSYWESGKGLKNDHSNAEIIWKGRRNETVELKMPKPLLKRHGGKQQQQSCDELPPCKIPEGWTSLVSPGGVRETFYTSSRKLRETRQNGPDSRSCGEAASHWHKLLHLLS